MARHAPPRQQPTVRHIDAALCVVGGLAFAAFYAGVNTLAPKVTAEQASTAPDLPPSQVSGRAERTLGPLVGPDFTGIPLVDVERYDVASKAAPVTVAPVKPTRRPPRPTAPARTTTPAPVEPQPSVQAEPTPEPAVTPTTEPEPVVTEPQPTETPTATGTPTEPTPTEPAPTAAPADPIAEIVDDALEPEQQEQA